MSVSIGSNIASLNAQRRLGQSSSALKSVYERLSSGQRINKASDDAAGLAISSQLNTNSRIFSQAVRNLNDGISYLGIAEGALSEISRITTRSIELAEQSANGTYSSVQRAALDNELQALSLEHSRILASTEFNGRRILRPAAEAEELRLQAGIGESGSISLLISAEAPGAVAAEPTATWDGTFGTETTGTFINQRRAFTAGDFDNDGVTDVVTIGEANFLASYYNLLLGNADGTYQAPYSGVAGYNNNDNISFINAYDINNDGNLDLVTANDGNFIDSNGLSVILGNGDGTFNSQFFINGIQTGGAQHFSFGDFNEDNYVDIAWTRANGATALAFGNGDGTFAAPQSLLPNAGFEPDNVHVYDFNADGDLDIVNIIQGVEVHLQLGNGDGTFASSGTFLTGLDWADFGSQGAVGDFNEDGLADIAILVPGQDFITRLSIILGNGDGTFSAGITKTANYGYNMAVYDINADGYDDIVGGTNLHLSNGDGTFSTTIIPSTSSANLSFFGNVNGDSIPDLITGGIGAGIGNYANLILNATTSGSSEESSSAISILSVETAREALTALNQQLTTVSQTLGEIGAFQSRLTVAINYLSAARNNYKEAEGRIMDADIASDSAELTRQQILQQTAASVLSQANQLPALALTLLR